MRAPVPIRAPFRRERGLDGMHMRAEAPQHVGQNVIGPDQQVIAREVDVAHLAAGMQRQRQIRRDERSRVGQRRWLSTQHTSVVCA